MPQQNMTLEVFEQVISSVRGLRHVELQGEGEPMLHPDFFRMGELIRQLHPNARISLITNGSLLSAENVARLLAIGFHKVCVSIESRDAGEFAAIRGGKLEKVLDGIRLLLQARRARQAARPAIGLAITVLRRTLAEFAGLLDLYDELGLDGGITYQFLQTMPAYSQHYGPEMLAQIPTLSDRTQFADAMRRSPRVRKFFTRRTAAIGFYNELFAGWQPRSGECPWLSRGLYVAYDGTATGCCFIKNTARDGLGAVTPNSAEQVSANRRAMQDELRAGRIPTACSHCPIAERIVAEASPSRRELPYNRR
jgi:MoaA/NifB/PqqE/SkfB family radical SAM enzyme